jgi:cyclic beta-1,2-glucan synthetase
LLPVDDGAMLLSWSGSMFEYLMPSLVMYTLSNSLLDGTCKLAVKRQIEYGTEARRSLGCVRVRILDARPRLVYQYSAFGVPGLGFKRGLRQDLVIAPYATALASMYDKRAAAENFDRLQSAGGCGIYGFYEALDYTPIRLPEGKTVSVVKAQFAHHQGMSLVALTNALVDDVMRQRFHRHPMIEAADLLLQERTPREIVPSQIPMQEKPAAPCGRAGRAVLASLPFRAPAAALRASAVERPLHGDGDRPPAPASARATIWR